MIGTNHINLLLLPSGTALLWPQTTPTCLMVVEAWHREWSGKSFNAVAQISDASHGLWVLDKEVFKFLELPWWGNRRKYRKIAATSNKLLFRFFWPFEFQLTGFLLDVQAYLEAFIHELNNLYKICLFELSGSESWSTCNTKHSKVKLIAYSSYQGAMRCDLRKI